MSDNQPPARRKMSDVIEIYESGVRNNYILLFANGTRKVFFGLAAAMQYAHPSTRMFCKQRGVDLK